MVNIKINSLIYISARHGAGPDPNTGAAGNADADAGAGNANPGDDVVDGDFKEV